MDGILVAYHNTLKLFGFEYFSLDEMETELFGSSAMGEQQFLISLQLWDEILGLIVARYPEQDSVIFISAPSKHKISIYIESKNAPKNEIPMQIDVETRSFIDGKVAMKPLVTAGQDWEVKYSIEEFPFDPSRYGPVRKRFDDMSRPNRGNGVFISNLKRLIGEPETHMTDSQIQSERE